MKIHSEKILTGLHQIGVAAIIGSMVQGFLHFGSQEAAVVLSLVGVCALVIGSTTFK